MTQRSNLTYLPIRRIFRVVNGGTPSADADNWDGGITWVTPEDLGSNPVRDVATSRRTLSATGLQSSSATVVPKGSVVLSTRAPIGHVKRAAAPLATNQGCRSLVPLSAETDTRFYCYVLEAAKRDLEAEGRGTTFVELGTENLSSFRVPAPAPPAQRAIADYLDRETARIDQLILVSRRMRKVLDEQFQGVLEERIRSLASRYGEIPLKYTCREIVVGIVIRPSTWYAEVGVPALRGVNVRPGRIVLDDLVYVTSEGHALHAKSRLRHGDVVIVRTGQAGAAAVVPTALEGANCIDLVIARPGAQLDAHFLEFVLNSDWMQKHVNEHSVGSIQSHFNVGAVKAVRIPRISLAEQQAAVKELRGERLKLAACSDALSGRILLLEDRRSALITATVTGQIDVTKAAA